MVPYDDLDGFTHARLGEAAPASAMSRSARGQSRTFRTWILVSTFT